MAKKDESIDMVDRFSEFKESCATSTNHNDQASWKSRSAVSLPRCLAATRIST